MAPWYNSTLPSVSTLIAMADPSTSYGQWREREREREREKERERKGERRKGRRIEDIFKMQLE